MYPLDPSDHLQVLAQDRVLHMQRQRLLRIAQARADLTRRERRVDEARRELIQALDNASSARRTLIAIGPPE